MSILPQAPLKQSSFQSYAPAFSSGNPADEYTKNFMDQRKELETKLHNQVSGVPEMTQTQQNQVVPPATSKPGMQLFNDEAQARERMLADNLGEDEITQRIKDRRKELMGGRSELTTIEVQALERMRDDGISSDEAIQRLYEHRNELGIKKQEEYDNLPLWKKAGQQVVGAGMGAFETIGSSSLNILGWGAHVVGADSLGKSLKNEAKAWEQAGEDIFGSGPGTSAGYNVGNVIGGAGMFVGSMGMGGSAVKGLEAVPKLGTILPKAGSLGSKVLAGAIEGGAQMAGSDIANTGETSVGSTVGGAVLGGALPLAGAGIKKGIEVGKRILPGSVVPEEKILSKIGMEKVKGTIDGKTVEIPVEKKRILEKITTPFREKDTKVLAGRALMPSYAGKTPKQMLKIIGDVESNLKEYYKLVRTGTMKGDLSTLEEAANSVISNLDDVGSKIGGAVKSVEGTISPSVGTLDEISGVLGSNIEKRGGAYKVLENFKSDTQGGLNIQEAFKAKKIYQAEIGKLIRAGDSGTDSYSALVKGVQELTDSIDNVIASNLKGKEFEIWKKQYALLKKIATDISKSAVVEGRRAPQTFVEQLGTLDTILDLSRNPLSTAKGLFAREIGELNTRGGAWKELIKIYDSEAIKGMGKAKKIPKPSGINLGKKPVGSTK